MKDLRLVARVVGLAVIAVALSGGSVRSGEVALYDTVLPLASPLTAEVLQEKPGWKSATAASELRGDAVIENSLMVVDVRPRDGRLSIYYKREGNIRLLAGTSGIRPRRSRNGSTT